MDSKKDSQIQNWSLTLADTSRQQWQTNLPIPRQLSFFPPATLLLPASFTSHHPGQIGTPSVVITNKPLIVLEDSLAARVLCQGASRDPYASFITTRHLPQPIQQNDESFYTNMSVVPSLPSHTYEPLSEHIPCYSDEYKGGGPYFQPGASNIAVCEGIGAKTVSGLAYNALKATDLQPTITLMEDQSVPDTSQYPLDDEISFSDDPTPKKNQKNSLDETVIPETPPVPVSYKPDDNERSESELPHHLLDGEYSRQEASMMMVDVNIESAETQHSFGERIINTWANGIVSLASNTPVTAQSMTADEYLHQTDAKLFNPLMFPAIEWKPKTAEDKMNLPEQPNLSNPPTPPPLPMNKSLKTTNNEKGLSEIQATTESLKYPTLRSLNLAGLGLNVSTLAAPHGKANETRKSVILNLPTLPVLMNTTASSSDILKLTACTEREDQMFEESDSEMEMPDQETLEETNECSVITADQLHKDSDLEIEDKDHQAISTDHQLDVHKDVKDSELDLDNTQPISTDHQLNGTVENPEQNIILENSQDLPVLTQAAKTKEDYYSSEKTLPLAVIVSQSESTDQFLEPPLKKLRLSENDDELMDDIGCEQDSTNTKPNYTYPATNLIPENFHNPSELADEGIGTTDQAFPTESARLHSLVPRLVSCRVSQDQGGDRDENDSQKFELPVPALENDRDARDLGYPQTALVPVESLPVVDEDQGSTSNEANETSLPKISVSTDEHMDTGNRETIPPCFENEMSSSGTLTDGLPISSCTLDQQIVPEAGPSMDESLGPFYESETKVVTASLPVSRAQTDDSMPTTKSTESEKRKLCTPQEGCLVQVIPEVAGAFQQQWSASGGPMKNSAKSQSESIATTRLNLKRPKLRLGLSKKQKCKSLHL